MAEAYKLGKDKEFPKLVKQAKKLAQKKLSPEELKKIYMNPDGVTFKGKPGTGERYHNCVLYMIASGKPVKSAIRICTDICHGKYGRGACMGVQARVMQALGIRTLEWFMPFGADLEILYDE